MDILNFISWIKGGRQVTTVDPSKTLLPVGLKDGRRDDGYLAGAISVADFLNLVPTPPSGLEGTSFILVKGEGTAAENGLELQAAYDAAKLATPYGDALSTLNRFTIIVAPGDYYSDYVDPIFGPIGQFNIDADFIDIKSLTGNADVFLSGITVSAQDVYLRGLNTTQAGFMGGAQAGFNIAISSPFQTFDTCVGGNNSFGWGGTLYGTFINCNAGNRSFCSAASSTAPIGITEIGSAFSAVDCSGTFTNCNAGDFSFGANLVGQPDATGTFTNCTAFDWSFGVSSGSTDGRATGVFKNCTTGSLSMAAFGYFQGTAFNCVTANMCFGNEIRGGSLYYCKSSSTYPVINPILGGRIILCIENGNTVRTESI
jgi:hypothetical protein